MDSNDDEEDVSMRINELLKSLAGVEQCFVPDDSEWEEPQPVELEPDTPPLKSPKKRPADPSLPSESIPPSKRINLRDPRLNKMRPSFELPLVASLSVPNFVNGAHPAAVNNVTNAVIPGLEYVYSKPVQIFGDSTKHSNANSRANTKLKEEILEDPRKIADLELPEIDYDSIFKGLSIIESVKMNASSSQSQTAVEGRFDGTSHVKSETRQERRQSEFGERSNGHITNDLLRLKSTAASIPSMVRDPRIRKSLEEKILANDSNKQTSTTYCSPFGGVITNSLQNDRKLLITNPPSNSNVSVKLSSADNRTNANNDKIKELPNRMEWLETKTSFVNDGPENSRKSIPNLPRNVLVNIFTYLRLADMKNTKLVCKHWYDASNTELLQKRQKFLCCGAYNTALIMRILSNSACTCLNLEFDGVLFANGFTELWKRIGPRIHTLYFVDCLLGPKTMWEVILNCTEMKQLSLSFKSAELSRLTAFSVSLFKDLFRQQIKRRKLTSLDIHITNSNGCWLSNSILSNLFVVYPNITSFGFTHHALDPVAELSDLWSSSTLTLSPVFEYINRRSDSMEKLELNVQMKGSQTPFAWQLMIPHIKFTRLREIVIDIDTTNSASIAFIEVCLAQSELERIHCTISGSSDVFLLKLLHSCPRLRDLKLTNNVSFFVSCELFRGLVLSKLKSLSIVSKDVSFERQITDECDRPVNENLHSLSLCLGVDSNFKNLFVTSFRKLKFLEVHNPSDDLLQLIWMFHTELVTLKLIDFESCSFKGFCARKGVTGSIRNLQNLEYLVLESKDKQICGNIFSQLHLPRLRYLYVNIKGSKKSRGSLLSAIRKSTELEGVSLSLTGVERSAWLQLNKNWKKLRYLRIVDKESGRFKMKQYYNYFTISPNLRALFHEFIDSSESFYYDIIDKVVKKKASDMKYHISSTRVGCSFVDWLWF